MAAKIVGFLKLANTFVLPLVEEKLTPMSSLYFSAPIFLTTVAKQSKTVEKCLYFTVEYLTLFD